MTDIPKPGIDQQLDDQSADQFAQAPLEVLENDENIPPRPEEELADAERSEPDPR